MHDVGLDPTCPEPSRQPEAVPTGLESDSDAFDLVPDLFRFLPPSIEQAQQGFFAGLQRLQGLALDARYDPGHKPALLLNSIMAIKVSLTFSAVGDRLRSLSGLRRFGLRIGGSIVGFRSAPMDATDLLTLRRSVHLPRRIPHSI